MHRRSLLELLPDLMAIGSMLTAAILLFSKACGY